MTAVLGRVWLWGLCGDKGVGWDFGAISHISSGQQESQSRKDEEHARSGRAWGGARGEGNIKGQNILKLAELRLGRIPYFDSIGISPDQLLEVDGQGFAVDLVRGTRAADALCDIEDDAREAVLVYKDLLIVGHLAQLGHIGEVVWELGLESTAEERRALVVVSHDS